MLSDEVLCKGERHFDERPRRGVAPVASQNVDVENDGSDADDAQSVDPSCRPQLHGAGVDALVGVLWGRSHSKLCKRALFDCEKCVPWIPVNTMVLPHPQVSISPAETSKWGFRLVHTTVILLRPATNAVCYSKNIKNSN